MRRLVILAAVVAALGVAGCGTLSGGNSEATSQLLQNLRHCERHYIGSLGGLAPPAASVSISCPAEPYAPVRPAEEPA